ncbi:MAG TPA: phosphatase PAP2 family protein, partial [Acidimicrobiales bacterium]|nr:phosphatase PAP2 family protein [Acidimicrobiales bacterium]
ASAIAENSKIWMVLAIARWFRGNQHRFVAKRAFVAIFVESAVVNLGIKSLFRRPRPDHSGDHPYELREPWTSSFPSGHATAAFCAATLLSDGDPLMAPVYFAMAGIIAASRVHVKMHHGSDVLAGAIMGTCFGLLGRFLAPSKK